MAQKPIGIDRAMKTIMTVYNYTSAVIASCTSFPCRVVVATAYSRGLCLRYVATNNPVHSSSQLRDCSNADFVFSVTIAFTKMTPPGGNDVPPTKRRRLDDTTKIEANGTGATSTSLSRPVSPPLSRRRLPTPAIKTSTSLLVPAPTWSFNDVSSQTSTPPASQPPASSEAANQSIARPTEERQIEESEQEKADAIAGASTQYAASPFQLTKIRDLAPYQNVDTVELKDILGNPLIRECWNFNFLFDLDFVM